jgi:hypothetical protein
VSLCSGGTIINKKYVCDGWTNIINMMLSNGDYALNFSDADTTKNVQVILVECKGA